MGDPAGIGPEVVLKALSNPKVRDACRPLVLGDAQFLSLSSYGSSLKVRPILNPAQARYRPGTVDVLHLPCSDFRRVKPGQPNAVTGAASAFAVQKSVELALTRLVDGVAHAPISKTAWRQAGIRYEGHTEMIAELCGKRSVAMAIVAEPLRTVMVTRHIPLNKVAGRLKKAEIVETVRLAREWLVKSGFHSPKIGVCALNPHAGEGGLIGREEILVVAPAVRQAQVKYPGITGPIPADSAFRDHRKGLYDCLITLYHDQSLIPLKLLSGEKLVNLTLGLPFPRTSPGHGTAFDIAGKRRADPRAMVEAILTAARWARR